MHSPVGQGTFEEVLPLEGTSDPMKTCDSATLLLAMVSNGCFQSPSFVRPLFQAESRGIGAIQIIVVIPSSFRRTRSPKNPVHCQHTYCQGLGHSEAPMISSH